MKYNPGVCNIGRNEIRKRYAIGVFGFVFSALIIYIFISLSLNSLYLLLSFIPLFIGFEGFYQGYFHFCAGFAAAGIYDLTESGVKKGRASATQHLKDMIKARKIHIYSIISSLIVTAIIYFLY